jgi:hypothetical protein
VKPSNEVVLGVVLEFGEPKFKENFTMCELEARYHMSLDLELGMVKCFFPYTHANKAQEFNHKH